MIYCVIPEEMADELFDRLNSYYGDDPNVTVIVDRRKSARRAQGSIADGDEQREVRDRRRARVAGEFPAIDGPEA